MGKKAKYWVVEANECTDTYSWDDDLENNGGETHHCDSDEVIDHCIKLSLEDAKQTAEKMLETDYERADAHFVNIWSYDEDGKFCSSIRCWAQKEEKITPKWS